VKNIGKVLIIFITNITMINSMEISVGNNRPRFSLSDVELTKELKDISISLAIVKKHTSKKLVEKQPNKEVEKIDVKSEGSLEKPYNPSDKDAVANFRNDDSIESILSSVKNNPEPQASKDDLVFYDYAVKDENKKVEKKTGKIIVDSIQTVASAPIPKSIRDIIKREMINNKESRSSKSAPAKVKEKEKPRYDNFEKNTDTAGIHINAVEYTLGGGITSHIDNFQFQTPFKEDQINNSDLNGVLELEATSGVLRGTMLYHGSVSTKVELPIINEVTTYTIPMLSYESVRDYMDKHEIEGNGGMYLVELSQGIQDVDIEVNAKNLAYETRVLLDEDFKEASGDSAKYILFLGVVTGNVNIKVLGHNGQTADKITMITPDEILYDFIDLMKEKRQEVSLLVKNTMSQYPSKLNLSTDKIKTVVNGEHPQKVSEAKYIFPSSSAVFGMKKYIELDFLKDKIYYALKEESVIELPSNEFISEVLTQLEIEGLEERCLLQVDLAKDTTDISISLESDNGQETLDILYLDKDGIFTDEVSALTKQAFVLGYTQGIINLRAKQQNGNTVHMRSFCSAATYLVEHL
jgi:hypothetical protein